MASSRVFSHFAKSVQFIKPFPAHRRSSPFSSIQSQNGNAGAIWTRMGARYFSSAVEVTEFEEDGLHDTVKAMEKVTALHLALSRLAGDFCDESRLSLQRFFGVRRKPAISTGSLKLDLALGIGGLPKGRIVEIYGREASGKTTLALHVVKEAQKLGGYCAYLDVENALDPTLVESIGVNTEDLLISQPDCAENLLSMVDTLAKSGSVDVIVVDSVAALLPQRDIDLEIGNKYPDIQKDMMTKALRKIYSSLQRSETIIIFVNQVRFQPRKDLGFSNAKEVTCGGNALPFYSAVRLRLVRKGVLKTNDMISFRVRQFSYDVTNRRLEIYFTKLEKITGLGICVEVVKNKLAPAMKTAELGIHFGRGICSAPEVLELGCEHGAILREGDDYFIDGEVLHSKEDAETYLDQNDTARDKLVKTIRNQLFPENRV